MDKWEYKSLEWIHKTREANYKKTKNLSAKKLIEKTRLASENVVRELGLKVIKSVEKIHIH